MVLRVKKPSPPRDPITGRFVRAQKPAEALQPVARPTFSMQAAVWDLEDEEAYKANRKRVLIGLALVLLSVSLVFATAMLLLTRPVKAADNSTSPMQFTMDMCRARVSGALVTQEMLKYRQLTQEQAMQIQTLTLQKLAKEDTGTMTLAESMTTMMACHLLTADLTMQGILTPQIEKTAK